MEVVSIVALAGALGFVFTFIQTHVAQYIPANKYLQSRAGQAVVNGVLILGAFVIATFVVRKLHLSKHLPKELK